MVFRFGQLVLWVNRELKNCPRCFARFVFRSIGWNQFFKSVSLLYQGSLQNDPEKTNYFLAFLSLKNRRMLSCNFIFLKYEWETRNLNRDSNIFYSLLNLQKFTLSNAETNIKFLSCSHCHLILHETCHPIPTLKWSNLIINILLLIKRLSFCSLCCSNVVS